MEDFASQTPGCVSCKWLLSRHRRTRNMWIAKKSEVHKLKEEIETKNGLAFPSGLPILDRYPKREWFHHKQNLENNWWFLGMEGMTVWVIVPSLELTAYSAAIHHKSYTFLLFRSTFDYCAHGDDIEERKWLEKDTIVYGKLRQVLTKKSLQNGIKQASPFLQTSALESFPQY
eukprot:gene5612-10821_t